MVIFWRIRYLDRTDRQFKDRDLYLDTDALDAVTKAAVEFVMQSRSSKSQRDILRFRHLFQPNEPETFGKPVARSGFCLPNYFEDETGTELSDLEIGPILTGNPKAVMVPDGFEQHDLDFFLAEPKPIPVDLYVPLESFNLLGVFVRDFRELSESAFIKEGPGNLVMNGAAGDPTLETAVTDDEIRSFVTIFRRLYMTKEPANFLKAAEVFADLTKDDPVGTWVGAVAKSYEATLTEPPDVWPYDTTSKCTFTAKRLIDVFLYTRYAHQPSPERERQFRECLGELGGRKGLLTWLFLLELRELSRRMINAGRPIAMWFKEYCDHNNLTPTVVASLLDDHPGIGKKEKEAVKKARLFAQKTQELATELWKMAGSPPSGAVHYLHQAHEDLTKALKGQQAHERPGT